MDYYEEKFRKSGKIIRMLWRLLLLTLAFTLGLCVITLLESCKPIQKVVAVRRCMSSTIGIQIL